MRSQKMGPVLRTYSVLRTNILCTYRYILVTPYRYVFVGQDSLLKPCALCTSNHVHAKKKKSEHMVQEMSPFTYLPLESCLTLHPTHSTCRYPHPTSPQPLRVRTESVHPWYLRALHIHDPSSTVQHAHYPSLIPRHTCQQLSSVGTVPFLPTRHAFPSPQKSTNHKSLFFLPLLSPPETLSSMYSFLSKTPFPLYASFIFAWQGIMMMKITMMIVKNNVKNVKQKKQAY